MADIANSPCSQDQNSTDCLLRLLYMLERRLAEEGEKFDWDPITFAFTVPIGLFAALFAAITIYQAILAAGPGRRKSGSRAIGAWASRTKKEWSWHELNRLSIVATPVLRADNILQTLGRKAGIDDHGRDETGASEKRNVEPPAATWLRFIEHAGLQTLIGPNFTDVETTVADYLPDDLLAVPAYAEVGLIVAMAAAAGAHSLRVVDAQQSLYPIIIGDGFQFDFRQHPTLGTIIAFSRYGNHANDSEDDPLGSLRRLRGPDLLASAIRCSQGIVTGSELATATAHTRSSFDLIGAEVALAGNLHTTDQTTSDSIVHAATSHQCDPDKERCLDNPFHREDDHGLLWLLVADTPRNIPHVFPSKLSRGNPSGLIMLALSSKVWSHPRTSGKLDLYDHLNSYSKIARIFQGPLQHVFPEHVTTRNLDRIEAAVWESNSPEIASETDEFAPGYHRIWQEAEVVVFPEIVEHSLSVLHDFHAFQTWLASLHPTRRQYFRVLLLIQLQQIDKWLKMECGEGTTRVCRTRTIYHTTSAFLNAEKAISGGRFGYDPDHGHGASEQDRRRWDALALDNPSRHDVLARHFPMLRTLGPFLDECPGNEENWEPFHDEYGKQIESIVLGGAYVMPDAEALLKRMRDIVYALYDVYETTYGTKGSPMGPQTAKTAERLQTKYQDVIDDMLVWRCILIAALFWTAPDNSEILGSGLWEHIVPFI